MIVLGVDIGSQNFAVAVVSVGFGCYELIESTTYKICKPRQVNLIRTQRKISKIIMKYMDEYKVEITAIEKQPWTFSKNSSLSYITALNIAIEAQLLSIISHYSCVAISVNPKQVKLITKISGIKTVNKYINKLDYYKTINVHVCNAQELDVHQFDALFIAITCIIK